MKKVIALFVCLCVASAAFAGVSGDRMVYRGGSAVIEAGKEGKVTLSGDALVYQVGKAQYAIPYKSVQSIEYGQKAGRRIGAAVATTILVSPLGLAMLLSKKRNHIVTLEFTGADGKTESAVFELGKSIVRPVLSALEARSGKQVEYESEDAKKNIGR